MAIVLLEIGSVCAPVLFASPGASASRAPISLHGTVTKIALANDSALRLLGAHVAPPPASGGELAVRHGGQSNGGAYAFSTSATEQLSDAPPAGRRPPSWGANATHVVALPPASGARNGSAFSGEASSVPRTIALRSGPGLYCLDLPGGMGDDTRVQVWECNGHTDQLWLFDAGSWEIQYAADPSKCLDAGGGSQSGAELFMWECNGQPQQKFGYDYDAGAIFLADTSLCMDAYSDMAMGNRLQLWECNQQPQQQFEVNWGTTIRLNADYTLCFDVVWPPQNGAELQLWDCNGHTNQQFVFDPATSQLKYGGDPDLNLCVDAHDVSVTGTRLFLWDCNGMSAQAWGYDASMQTIYLSTSRRQLSASDAASADQPNANLCVDLTGGDVTPGTALATWDCNACWNQQFLLGGGVTQASAWGGSRLRAPRTCPPNPHAPASTCAGGWPSFSSAAELSASPWGDYISEVYGEVPQDATYPWCMGDLWSVYKDRIDAHGATIPASVGTCPNGGAEGQLYEVNNQFQPDNMMWVWHATRDPFADNEWIEVIHMSGLSDEHTGAWFFFAKGSGIWFNVGKTIHFNDHGDAYKYFGAKNNEDMAGKAGAKGFDSVQFLKHSDCEFKQCNKKNPGLDMSSLNYEIVSTKLVGKYACTSQGGNSDLIRTGWQGANKCVCDNSKNAINCAGVPIQEVKKLGKC